MPSRASAPGPRGRHLVIQGGMTRMNHVLTLFALTLIGADGPKPSTVPAPAPCPAPIARNKGEARELWNMTLREAIRIGLDNSEAIRVVSLGAQGIPAACAGGRIEGAPEGV